MAEDDGDRAAAALACAALVVVGHGSSHNPGASRATYVHAEAVRRRQVFADVREAFWKEPPYLGQILDTIDAVEVFVVPNLACKGYITTDLIPREMGLAGELTERPGPRGLQRIHLCDPVGMHPLLAEAIAARARAVAEAHRLAAVDTCVLLVGHGSSRDRRSSIQTETVAECLRRSGIAAEVRTAFLEHAPRVEDWHRDIPAGNVVVAPFMISNGTHGAEDVPIRLGLDPTDPALERAAATGQPAGPFAVCGKRLWYCRAAGNEPTVAEIIVAQALAAWRRDRAAAQSRPSARPSNR